MTSNCICCRHCQSVLSWQAILLDAVPSAFQLRSLRRGRGGLSFAWQLFSCKFFRRASPPFRRLLILPSIYKGMGEVKNKPEIQYFWKPLHYVWSGKPCFLRLHSEFRRLAQNHRLGFVQYSVSSFIPFTCYHWEKAKPNPDQETIFIFVVLHKSSDLFLSDIQF